MSCYPHALVSLFAVPIITMITLYNVIHALHAVLQSISTEPVASGLANIAPGELAVANGNLSYPEPLIFYNLTREEFSIKFLEYRASRETNQRAIRHPTVLDKRWSTLDRHETDPRNGEFQRLLLIERNNDCEIKHHSSDWRHSSGWCAARRPWSVNWRCKEKSTPYNGPDYTKSCGPGYRCATTDFINWWGRPAKITYCQYIFTVNERVSDDSAAVPSYEGHQVIPPPVPNSSPDNPSLPHSPSVLDHIETFWDVDPPSLDVKAQWDYRGTYSNGNEFSSTSMGLAHTWSCIGCPAGILYVTLFGFTGKAVGSTFVSSLRIF